MLHGVTVKIVQRPEQSNEHAFVLFELGYVGDDEDTHAQMQALLEANHVLHQVHPPVFSRNPENGHAVLQVVLPLTDATPNDLYEMVATGIEWASYWREETLSNGDASAAGPREGTTLAMLHHRA